MQTPHTILLVDDDIDDHEFFSIAISKLNENMQLLKAENGQQAFSLLQSIEQLPDFVFLDLNMPAVDGKQFLRMIKEEPKFSDLYVVVYTTSSNEDDVKETMALGAKHYITKPDNINEIVHKLSFLLSN
jgi:CheY-like chemotaxis protein